MFKKIRNPKSKIRYIYAVILVGGRGKRLRPLSTDIRPKAFISVTHDRKTMFRRTVERIAEIIPRSNIVVVANKRHASLVRKDFPDIGRKRLILEPVSRNTAPAVTLAARLLKDISPKAIMVVLPSDHYIADEKKFSIAVRKGVEFADKYSDALVAFGIRPSCPAPEFGYIETHGQKRGGRGGHKVERFVEKPSVERAARFIKSGNYLWNSGIFVFRANAILGRIKRFAPNIYRGIEEKRYDRVPDISLDYAVMEKSGGVHCVECACGWSDVGGFGSLKRVLRRERRKFEERGGKVVRII